MDFLGFSQIFHVFLGFLMFFLDFCRIFLDFLHFSRIFLDFCRIFWDFLSFSWICHVAGRWRGEREFAWICGASLKRDLKLIGLHAGQVSGARACVSACKLQIYWNDWIDGVHANLHIGTLRHIERYRFLFLARSFARISRFSPIFNWM